ncbi:hypothetical protein [Bacillus sp. FJAT-52991]|uniref:HNH endonuclease n=1 Tax=Bacillus kandeliae TaxID=3129297 RepID=A0ABZ2N8F6_9BACI
MTNVKTCNRCNRTKLIEEFNKNPKMRDGRLNQCRECVREYRRQNADKLREQSRRYKEANREVILERDRQWRRTIEGRARKAFDKSNWKCRQYGKSTSLTYEDVLTEFKETKTCPYCNTALGMEPGKQKPTLEHIYSLNKDLGGVNNVVNILAVCEACNHKKGDMHVYNYYQSSDKFTDELWERFIDKSVRRLVSGEVTERRVRQFEAGMKIEADKPWHQSVKGNKGSEAS